MTVAGQKLQVQEWRFRIVRPTGNPDEPLRFRHASPQGEEPRVVATPDVFQVMRSIREVVRRFGDDEKETDRQSALGSARLGSALPTPHVTIQQYSGHGADCRTANVDALLMHSVSALLYRPPHLILIRVECAPRTECERSRAALSCASTSLDESPYHVIRLITYTSLVHFHQCRLIDFPQRQKHRIITHYIMRKKLIIVLHFLPFRPCSNVRTFRAGTQILTKV
ncbi:hypothetical protein ALC53_03177 [Atta colombica]|uniref:Uncharacterized protein n=1 Tax=Atta colombica TaxID=520822 RepID=A0A151I5C4_9HYME|nr:hypothetical protein ALC53_03177 [Atta colombica]